MQTRRAIRLIFGFVLGCLALTAQAAKEVTYYLTNPQGTPLATTDASGNITARFDQTGYGRDALDISSAIGFTGHVPDPETSLIYMQQRYYDRQIGRFLSVDPVIPSGSDGSNFNRYTYTNNNPYRYTDPDGRAFGEATAAGCALTIEIGCAPGAVIGLVVDSAIVIAAIAVPIYMSQDEAPVVVPEKDSSGPTTLTPGPYAGDSIPAKDSGKVFTPGERDAVDQIGRATGCHTCGNTDPGTKSGHFVPDHQPPVRLRRTARNKTSILSALRAAASKAERSANKRTALRHHHLLLPRTTCFHDNDALD